jgi:hypothetical protein
VIRVMDAGVGPGVGNYEGRFRDAGRVLKDPFGALDIEPLITLVAGIVVRWAWVGRTRFAGGGRAAPRRPRGAARMAGLPCPEGAPGHVDRREGALQDITWQARTVIAGLNGAPAAPTPHPQGATRMARSPCPEGAPDHVDRREGALQDIAWQARTAIAGLNGAPAAPTPHPQGATRMADLPRPEGAPDHVDHREGALQDITWQARTVIAGLSQASASRLVRCGREVVR